MKARLSVFGFAAVLVLGAMTASALAQSAKEPLRLPFPYIFSGPLIEFGERVWNEGLLPGVEVINQHGGIKGRPLEFYKVDVRFPETASWISDFRRLCADKTIPIIFGVGATKSLLAIYDDVKSCDIPVFNPSAGGSWPKPDFANWIFRYQPMPEDVMPILLKKAEEKLGLKQVAISYTLDDEFALYNYKVTKALLEKMGIKIVAEESFRTKETNFASQVAAIREAKPDAVFLFHQPGDAGTFLLQLRERGVNAQIISDVNVAGADFWKLSQGKGKGAIGYAIYAATDPRPIVQDWVKLWRQKTGKADSAPDGFVSAYFDGVQVMAHVLNSAKDLSREAIRDAFLQIKDYDTISGKIAWTKVGDVSRSQPVLVQVGDNDVLQVWP